MTATLHLAVRTPEGVLLEAEVRSVVGEDLSGWFGVWPRREDLVVALPPGLLLLRGEGAERVVAHAGGMLEVAAGRCRALVREASVADRVGESAEALARRFRRNRERSLSRRDVMADLEREALRRLAGEEVP